MENLFLQVINSSLLDVGVNNNYTFSNAGGVIGSSDECDWIIPTEECGLEPIHLRVGFVEGGFTIAPMRNAEVYLNDSFSSLDYGQEVFINKGDKIRLGKLDMQVRDPAFIDSSEVPDTEFKGDEDDYREIIKIIPTQESELLPEGKVIGFDIDDKYKEEKDLSSLKQKLGIVDEDYSISADGKKVATDKKVYNDILNDLEIKSVNVKEDDPYNDLIEAAKSNIAYPHRKKLQNAEAIKDSIDYQNLDYFPKEQAEIQTLAVTRQEIKAMVESILLESKYISKNNESLSKVWRYFGIDEFEIDKEVEDRYLVESAKSLYFLMGYILNQYKNMPEMINSGSGVFSINALLNVNTEEAAVDVIRDYLLGKKSVKLSQFINNVLDEIKSHSIIKNKREAEIFALFNPAVFIKEYGMDDESNIADFWNIYQKFYRKQLRKYKAKKG